MKEEVQALLQRDFALQALRSGVRVDGRALDAARTARIVLGPSHGQAHVTLGRTVALASATASPIAPYADRPAEGTLSVSVEVSAAASEPAALEFAVHGAHPPADRTALALRGLVERVIRDSRAIDTEALCILAGKRVWAVAVDVALVDAAGNAADAVHLAAMAALLHARRNEVSISGTDVHIHPFTEREPLPLPVHHVPLTVSYALFAASGSDQATEDIAALDPCLAEELAADGALTIALNAHGEVCGLHKAGGLPIAPALVVRCADFAARRVVQLTALLNKALVDSSVTHHPLAAVRPVLVAPEPTAVRPASRPDGMASDSPAPMDVDNAADGATFRGGISSWNAVPVNEALPPSSQEKETGKGDGAGVVESSPATLRESAKGLEENEIVDQIFRSVKRSAAKAEAPRQQLVQTPAVTKASISIDVDSEDSDDSDADLLAAVIAKPKGGGARGKAKPKAKQAGFATRGGSASHDTKSNTFASKGKR
jgi:exosome complex component RRP45